jgi:hypothetical protein
MKPKASYMDTWMLIGLAMFQIEDQPVVSCFLLEVVFLVGTIKEINICIIKHEGRIQRHDER